MNSVERLVQPYYVLRPSYLLRRLRPEADGDKALGVLPRGDRIQAR